MLIHNLIVEYGVYLSILLVLENILMFGLIIYSVYFYITSRKINKYNKDILKTYCEADYVLKMAMERKDCK